MEPLEIIMQTFLPFPNFRRSLQSLDYRRLGKQRVEAFQLLCALDYGPALLERFIRLGNKPLGNAWRNHPAAKMWKGYEHALAQYLNESIYEWRRRGYNNTMTPLLVPIDHEYPPWFGDPKFHQAHKSNLVRKLPEHYRPQFPNIPDNLEYIWPCN